MGLFVQGSGPVHAHGPRLTVALPRRASCCLTRGREVSSAFHSGENQTGYTSYQAVDDKRYHRSLKDKTVLIDQTQNRGHSNDVADGNHVAHGGAHGLQGQDGSPVEAQRAGNRILNGGEGKVRDGG